MGHLRHSAGRDLRRRETCRPAGELQATPPMLQVWLVDNECGPFAGIEGHGGDGSAPHEH